MKRLALQLRESKRLFKSFSKRAELVLKLGGTVSFEWPRPSTGWKRPDVVAFLILTLSLWKLISMDVQ